MLTMADGALLLRRRRRGPAAADRGSCSRRRSSWACRPIVVINKIDRPDARPHEVLERGVRPVRRRSARPTSSSTSRSSTPSAKLRPSRRELDDRADEPGAAARPHPREGAGALGRPSDAAPGASSATLDARRLRRQARHRRAWCAARSSQRRRGRGDRRVGVTGSSVKVLYTFEGLRRAACRLGQRRRDRRDRRHGQRHDRRHRSATSRTQEALPRIVVEEPTIKMRIGVNTSPFAGKSRRQVPHQPPPQGPPREGAQRNLALRVEPTETPDTFLVLGPRRVAARDPGRDDAPRGLRAALVERPRSSRACIDGETMEPMELVRRRRARTRTSASSPSACRPRRGRMVKMLNPRLRPRPPRVPACPRAGSSASAASSSTATRGTGLLNHAVRRLGAVGRPDDAPAHGRARRRPHAASPTPYALLHLQPRGQFFVVPGIDVYEGMIVGEHNRPNDTRRQRHPRGKKLTERPQPRQGRERPARAPAPAARSRTAMEWIDRRRAGRGHARRRARAQEGAGDQPARSAPGRASKRRRRWNERAGLPGRRLPAAAGGALAAGRRARRRERRTSALRGVTFLAALGLAIYATGLRGGALRWAR